MKTIHRSIEVKAPLTETYNQWTRFEEFPRFMRGIEEVKRMDARHTHWRAHIGGRTEEWDAELTTMIPNSVIAWRSTNGAENHGEIHFEPTDNGGTRVDVRIEYEPHSTMERLGSAMGMVERRVNDNLKEFRRLMEKRP
jgi:uncharacterized membrane protein